jgi:glyoxylase-like metal-dependent hydrolase (beta-lactamase superfamily II)
MADSVLTLSLGAATVSIINIGDIEAPLTTWMDPPPGGWPAAVAAVVTRPLRFPVNCILARLPGLTLLVDAGVYDFAPDSALAIPNYRPPAPLLTALAGLGVRPADVNQLVITHAHHDHFNGLTVSKAGTFVPAFPHARCLLGRADWERPETRNALNDPESLESRTLGALQQAGLLEFAVGEQDLGGGARIIAAPGETPGHQIVRLQSAGHTLYCVGDLFHHALEAEQPEYMVRWAEPRATLASRRALIDRAVAEDALVVATHIPGAGRLRRTAIGIRWLPA